MKIPEYDFEIQYIDSL